MRTTQIHIIRAGASVARMVNGPQCPPSVFRTTPPTPSEHLFVARPQQKQQPSPLGCPRPSRIPSLPGLVYLDSEQVTSGPFAPFVEPVELEEGVAGSSNRDENGKENESGKGDNGGQDEPVPAEVEAALNKLDYTLAVFSSLMKQVEHERIDGTGRGPLSTRGTMENQKGDDKDDCEQMALGLSKYLPLLAVDEGVEVVRRIMNWEMRRKKMRLGLSTLLMDELLVHDIARRVWKHKGDKVETEVIKPAYDAAQERQGFQGGCTVADRGL